MADLSKIKLNGTTYNLKDAEARQLVSDLEDSIPEVPSVLSELVNDVGYITSYTETDPTVPAWAKAESKPTYTASEVGALPSNTTYVSSINGNSGAVTLTIPTDTNDLTNSAGFITSYTETDPTVPAWAKAASKPTYTATEVGALPDNTTYVSSVNGSSGTVTVDKIKTTANSNNTEYNLLGTATTNNNTSAVSVYNQDLLSFAKTTSQSRLTVGSTSMPGVIRLYTSTNGANGYADLKVNVSSTNTREITFPDKSGTVAMTDDIPSIPSWALNSTKPNYAFSELTSHPTTLNDYGITNAYTKTEVDGLVSGVLHYKGTKATTSALPSSENITGDVWHITADGSEWAWDGSTWQELGTAVDLTGYLQSSDIAAWAKAANKPTYTANEVGALSSSTTYVSSFNGESGAITYVPPVTSVNGQTGAITITDSDEKLKTSSVTSNTTYYPIVGNYTSNAESKYMSGNFRFRAGNGITELQLGQVSNNSTEKGRITLCSGAYYTYLDPPLYSSINGNRTYTLPSTAGTLALTSDIPAVHLVELTYYDTINNNKIYTSTETISEVQSMINNNTIVILHTNLKYFYFVSDDSRSIYKILNFYGSDRFTTRMAPYRMNDTYTNYWYSMLINPTEITNTLSSGTLIATIDGTDIYAPAYTDADGVSY